jgi:hypothetical protein
MPEPKRATAGAALDSISDHLGIVLKRADALLAEWSTFGASVRDQVQREATTIGETVASSIDGAVVRATTAGIDRAVTDHLGARLAALTAELTRLEQRARAASRSFGDQRTGDRRVLWIVAAGVLIANALLVALLVRTPPATVAMPVPEPARIELVTPSPSPASPAESPATGSPTEPAAATQAGSAATGSAAPSVPGAGSGSAAAPKQAGSNPGSASSATQAPAPQHAGSASGATSPSPAKLPPRAGTKKK